jgi:hypothetical protein
MVARVTLSQSLVKEQAPVVTVESNEEKVVEIHEEKVFMWLEKLEANRNTKI